MNIKQYDKMYRIYDDIEKSLDIIDECYSSIYEKSKLEVLSDDPVVKQLLVDIRRSKEALLHIANNITSEFTQKENE